VQQGVDDDGGEDVWIQVGAGGLQDLTEECVVDREGPLQVCGWVDDAFTLCSRQQLELAGVEVDPDRCGGAGVGDGLPRVNRQALLVFSTLAVTR
jgi:hypothetical protein